MLSTRDSTTFPLETHSDASLCGQQAQSGNLVTISCIGLHSVLWGVECRRMELVGNFGCLGIGGVLQRRNRSHILESSERLCGDNVYLTGAGQQEGCFACLV